MLKAFGKGILSGLIITIILLLVSTGLAFLTDRIEFIEVILYAGLVVLIFPLFFYGKSIKQSDQQLSKIILFLFGELIMYGLFYLALWAILFASMFRGFHY